MEVLDREISTPSVPIPSATIPSVPVPEVIIREARNRGRRRKAAFVLLVLVVGGTAAIVVTDDSGGRRGGASVAKLARAAAFAPSRASEVAKPGGCGGTVLQLGKLPSWTAFAGVPTPALHAMSKNGTAVAVFFAAAPPLHFGPPLTPRNKILWLVRSAHGSLVVTARPFGSAKPATPLDKASEGNGPYMVPSYDNVTKPGCWAFTLNEGTATDTLDLYYERG